MIRQPPEQMTDDKLPAWPIGGPDESVILSFVICHLSFRGAESDAVDEPVGRLQVLV
jgi:hypothetical protein